MAGDWIKLEHATLDKPEVLRAAEMLGIHRREALGLFVEFWIWLDKNLSGLCPDFVRNMSRKSLDDVLHCPGFAAVLVSVGWAKFDDEHATMTIINAERHNGNPAKTRALDAKRKKEKRLENVREMSGLKTDKTGTREEKRRDITPIVPEAFDEFWNTYPGPRKISKTKCVEVWVSKNLSPLATAIHAHIAAMRDSPQWREAGGKFIPAPLTYLNQRRWEDGAPEAPARRVAI